MKHIVKISDYLLEALKLSQYRPFHNSKEGMKESIKSVLDSVFTKPRIYIDFETKKSEVNKNTENYKLIEDTLKSNGYEIVDYIEGYCRKSTDNPNATRRIGKVLMDLGTPDLLHRFNEDKDRKLHKDKGNLNIVISNHPYDIAGMSTDRGWTSCMDLDPDEKVELNRTERGVRKTDYIPIEIKGGVIVAYLIKSSDTNINKPLGRVSIKPYQSPRTKQFYWKVQKYCYGSVLIDSESMENTSMGKQFIDSIQEWLDTTLNKNTKSLIYLYNDDFYQDLSQKGVVNVPLLKKEIEKRGGLNKFTERELRTICKAIDIPQGGEDSMITYFYNKSKFDDENYFIMLRNLFKSAIFDDCQADEVKMDVDRVLNKLKKELESGEVGFYSEELCRGFKKDLDINKYLYNFVFTIGEIITFKNLVEYFLQK